MKFKPNDVAIIHSTNSELDGAFVSVVGISLNFDPLPGSSYVVLLPERLRDVNNGWDTLCITESCLELV